MMKALTEKKYQIIKFCMQPKLGENWEKLEKGKNFGIKR